MTRRTILQPRQTCAGANVAIGIATWHKSPDEITPDSPRIGDSETNGSKRATIMRGNNRYWSPKAIQSRHTTLGPPHPTPPAAPNGGCMSAR